jgi:hypothetical protein
VRQLYPHADIDAYEFAHADIGFNTASEGCVPLF